MTPTLLISDSVRTWQVDLNPDELLDDVEMVIAAYSDDGYIEPTSLGCNLDTAYQTYKTGVLRYELSGVDFTMRQRIHERLMQCNSKWEA